MNKPLTSYFQQPFFLKSTLWKVLVKELSLGKMLASAQEISILWLTGSRSMNMKLKVKRTKHNTTKNFRMPLILIVVSLMEIKLLQCSILLVYSLKACIWLTLQWYTLLVEGQVWKVHCLHQCAHITSKSLPNNISLIYL